MFEDHPLALWEYVANSVLPCLFMNLRSVVWFWGGVHYLGLLKTQL